MEPKSRRTGVAIPFPDLKRKRIREKYSKECKGVVPPVGSKYSAGSKGKAAGEVCIYATVRRVRVHTIFARDRIGISPTDG
ncbi:MAG: hypothetical protein WCT99_08005 [Bacteroidota bacterium]